MEAIQRFPVVGRELRRGDTGGKSAWTHNRDNIAHLFRAQQTSVRFPPVRLPKFPGSQSMSQETPIDVDRFKARLIAHRDELAGLAAAGEDYRHSPDIEQARVGRLSRMDAIQSQAVSMQIQGRRNLELQRIEAALTRIEEGEYGYCVSCGEQIEPERLDFDPAAPVCIRCARSAQGSPS